MKRFVLLCIMLGLQACSQEPGKNDWLQNAQSYAPASNDGADEDELSNVGHDHDHGGHR